MVSFVQDGQTVSRQLRSRALLWSADDGRQMLDRIYIAIGSSRHNEGCCDERLGNADECICKGVFRKYRRWALRHGVINRNSLSGEFKVTLKVNRHVPYMDTLHYGTFDDDDTLVVSNCCGHYQLLRTDGERPDNHHEYSCCAFDESLDDEQTHWAHDESYCESCFYDRFFHCTACGEGTRLEMAVEVDDQSYCPNCAARLFSRCHDCETHVRLDDLVTLNTVDGEVQLCQSCADTYGECDECGKAFQPVLLTTDDDGVVRCRACSNKASFSEHDVATTPALAVA